MMFALNAALALGLLTLVAGTALLMNTGKEGQCCRSFGKVVAYLTILLSILTLLGTSFYGIRYWVNGYFEYPHGMGMKMRGPKKCPMMEDGMKGRGRMGDGMGPGRMQRGMDGRGPRMDGMGPHGRGRGMRAPDENPSSQP